MTTATTLERDRSAPTRAITRLAARSLRADRKRNGIVVALVAAGVAIGVIVAVVLRSVSDVEVTAEASLGGIAAGLPVLVLTGALASGAFVTAARRRLREYGLLGANGASLAHVRGLVLRQASLLGALGALLGAGVGLALAPAVLSAGRTWLPTWGRAPLSLHALDVVGPFALGLLASILGAWVPAWLVGRVPAARALAGRMPSPPRTGRRYLGAALLAVGAAAAAVGSDPDRSDGWLGWSSLLLFLGASLAAGPVLEMLGRRAGSLPLAARLAVRDAARQRTRSAAVVVVLAAVFAVGTVGSLQLGQEVALHYQYGPLPSGLATISVDRDTNVPATTDDLDAAGVTLDEALDGLPTLHSTVDVRFFSSFYGPWGTDTLEVTLVTPESQRRLASLVVLDDDLASRLGIDPLPPGTVLLPDEEVDHWGRGPSIGEGRATLLIGGTGTGTREVEVRRGSAARHLPDSLFGPLVAPDLVDVLPAADVRTATLWRLADAPTQQQVERVWGRSPLAPSVSVTPEPPSMASALAIGALAVIAVCAAVSLLATALAAVESDGDLELMVAVGADPALRRSFHAMLAAHHVVVGLVLGVVPTALWMAASALRFDPSLELVRVPPLTWALLPALPLVLAGVTYVAARPSRATVVSRRVD